MPTCANCQNYFPNTMKIEGKPRNVQHRKYCIMCSPFGLHRTRPIGFVSAVSAGKKKCFRCGHVKPATDFYTRRKGTGLSPYCKPCALEESLSRITRFKQNCVNYKGGKCEICGYNRYFGALEFHHKNPTEKDFIISHSRAWTFNDKIKREIDKCRLLCSNCHREEHAKISGRLI